MFARGIFQELRKEPEGDPDYLEIADTIHELAAIQEKLDSLERLITDIEICNPETLQKSFRCGWQSGGQNVNYDFWTDGQDAVSERMLQLAIEEREQVRASLLEKIDELAKRRYQNSYTNCDFSSRGVED